MEEIQITGELVSHRVVGDDFWSIASLKASDGSIVAVTGKLLGVAIGDTIELSGAMVEHARFGPQLKARECRVLVPQTTAGVIAWLSSGGRFPGIGPARAAELLEHFDGPGYLWRAIEKTPMRLAEVKGITEETADLVHRNYLRFVGDRDRMIKFRSWGMTENQIARMLKVWGDKSEENLRANPYSLAEVVDGFGFLRSDNIAQRMGMPLDSPARIRAGLKHTMLDAQGHGHCYVSRGKLVALASERVLRVASSLVETQLRAMEKDGSLKRRLVPSKAKAAVSGDKVEAILSPQIDIDEAICARRVVALLGFSIGE